MWSDESLVDSADCTAADKLTVVAKTVAFHKKSRGKGASQDENPQGLLSTKELSDVEERFPDGITAAQLISLFATRGLKFSEATFRKYVQLGLVPRSRRIGRKGKHKGSLGVYPAKAVRRVNEIKDLMNQGYTIEEIQSQLSGVSDSLEIVGESFDVVFTGLEEEIAAGAFDGKAKRALTRDVEEAKKMADDLLERLEGLALRVMAPKQDSYGRISAAGSAEELL